LIRGHVLRGVDLYVFSSVQRQNRDFEFFKRRRRIIGGEVTVPGLVEHGQAGLDLVGYGRVTGHEFIYLPALLGLIRCGFDDFKEARLYVARVFGLFPWLARSHQAVEDLLLKDEISRNAGSSQ
jgi:hypothetical protein